MTGLSFASPRRVRTGTVAPLVALLLALVLSPARSSGQDRGAAALGPLVEGLGVSARVLFIAAHPDDEDTQLITWLAKGRHVETAYLALTRGDGGQNLIGNELGESLGAIRTEELLAARRLDGGRQYFTRAFDFGFSKNAEETLTQWSRDSILRDVVTVVRQFRPHVIIAVFSGTPADGHGHHQVSGIFAREAYDASGDTVRFPRSTTAGYAPWSVQKFYRAAVYRGQDQATLRMNVGEYDPILGRSYSEIAADSRSQHKSQAMGSMQLRGARFDQVIREASRAPKAPADAKKERDLFDGIDTTWTRFAPLMRSPAQRGALDSLPAAFAQARATLDLAHPEKSVPVLGRIARLLQTLCRPAGSPCADTATVARDAATRATLGERGASEDVWQVAAVNGDLAEAQAIALARAERALALASGVVVEATASREVWGVGEAVPVAVKVYNRGARPVAVSRPTMVAPAPISSLVGTPATKTIAPDSAITDSIRLTLDAPSEPWWLETPRAGAMFTPRTFGISETSRRAPATVQVAVAVDGAPTQVIEAPVVFRYADPIKGDTRHPVAAAPAVTLTLDDAVAYARANTQFERAIRVAVRSHTSAARDVTVRLQLPKGLMADSAERRVHFPGVAKPAAASGPGAAFGIGGGPASDQMEAVTFQVRGRLAPGRHVIAAIASSGGATFTTGFTQVQYDHIRPQRLYRPATLGVEAVDLTLPRAVNIAYIAGVGDNVAPMLEQLGVSVTVLDPAALPRTDLSHFAAVVVGTRAYEASDALVANNARLLDYTRAGGTLVVQYGQYEMTRPGIMPFPITLSRPADRVTVEGAPVTIIDSAATVLTAPNAITARDFEGWIQDRTLYMPHTFDPAYKPVFETHDPGEEPNRGALLVAPYGKGTYVYTTFAFFRQLPNGNPGAARLMINLLSAHTGIVP